MFEKNTYLAAAAVWDIAYPRALKDTTLLQFVDELLAAGVYDELKEVCKELPSSAGHNRLIARINHRLASALGRLLKPSEEYNVASTEQFAAGPGYSQVLFCGHDLLGMVATVSLKRDLLDFSLAKMSVSLQRKALSYRLKVEQSSSGLVLETLYYKEDCQLYRDHILQVLKTLRQFTLTDTQRHYLEHQLSWHAFDSV